MKDTPEFETNRGVTRRRDDEGAARGPRGPDHDAQHLASTLGNANVGSLLRSGDDETGLDESVARAIEQRRGGGSPLPGGVQREMEGHLGYDLSDVRVHTDRAAHELNESVRARAFTVGSDVFFKDGHYDASSTDGKKLLAHELTHVVQQGGSTAGAPSSVSSPDDASEQQADAVAESITQAGEPAAAAGVSRQVGEEEEELQMQPLEEEEEIQASSLPRGTG